MNTISQFVLLVKRCAEKELTSVKKNLLQGDSGGPNLCYDPKRDAWILFGTVSYGPSDCDRESGDKWLTVSVDLSNYRRWILTNILKNS